MQSFQVAPSIEEKVEPPSCYIKNENCLTNSIKIKGKKLLGNHDLPNLHC